MPFPASSVSQPLQHIHWGSGAGAIVVCAHTQGSGTLAFLMDASRVVRVKKDRVGVSVCVHVCVFFEDTSSFRSSQTILQTVTKLSPSNVHKN